MNRRQRFTLSLLAALTLGLAAPAIGQEIKAEEHTLSNGMRLLLVKRTDEPTISAGWVAHVGSVNERPGITGISHFFEHMMFKGTPTIGTKDAKKDLEIIEKQEKVREEMRQELSKMRTALRRGEVDDLGKPENKSPRYKELEKEFDALVQAQRDILVKNEFDRIYTRNGASGMNAFTTYDMTGYFITVPKNKLELWMWMESDRLKSPVFREFYAERDVVYEERRLRVESTPTGKLEEAFDSMFWHSTPYTWPVIGYPSDVPMYTLAQANEYYATYYAPNNITAILVGDLDPKEAVAAAEKYFGRIPRGKNPVPEVTTLAPKWESEMRFSGEAETNPTVEMRWHTVPFQNKDSYPLEVLAQLLNGRTGRLYKGMIQSANPVATEASAAHNPPFSQQKYAGAFSISAEARDGKTLEDVEKGIVAELEKLKKDPIPAEELQKVKNNVVAGSFRRLSSNMAILFQLIIGEGYGDWREVNEAPKKIQAVTAEDVKRVANTYLVKGNQAVSLISRKGGTAPVAEDPALAAVPEQMRPMIKQSLQKISAETDAEKLKQMVERLQSQSASVPAEAKAGFDLLLDGAQKRLAEISKK
jgi:predicted Zn-dependent peptidase